MAKASESTHGQTINAIPPGGSASLEKIDFGGALEARKLPSGAVYLYWRFTADGRTERIRIGPYDPSAPPKSLEPTRRGYSVKAAQLAARELAKLNAATPGGLRAERERQTVAAEAEQKALPAFIGVPPLDARSRRGSERPGNAGPSPNGRRGTRRCPAAAQQTRRARAVRSGWRPPLRCWNRRPAVHWRRCFE